MKRILTLTVLGAALSAVSASAATITIYNSLGAFNGSAIVGGTPTYTETFNTNSSLYTTFTLVGGSQNSATRGFSNGQWVDQVDTNPLQTTTVSLNNALAMRAAGANFDLTPGGTGSNLILTINFANNTSQEVAVMNNYSAPFFLGFTSDTDFVSFTLSAGNVGSGFERYQFDNLVIEEALSDNQEEPPPSSVPEPSTFGLMGAAMVGLGLLRRVRR